MSKLMTTNNIKQQFSEQMAITNECKSIVSNVISNLNKNGQKQLANQLQPLISHNLILLEQSHIELFGYCMQNMKNEIVDKLDNIDVRITSRIDEDMKIRTNDVMETTEYYGTKAIENTQRNTESINKLINEINELKKNVKPLADRSIQQLADDFWNQFGTNYANKKLTKTLICHIIEDVKRLI